MKYIVGFVVICSMACGATPVYKDNFTAKQNDNNDKILWSSKRKLKWSDFKGKNQNIFDSRKAETVIIISTEKTYYNNEKVPIFEIGCYFLTKESWTITSEELALKHEQLHFDIGELYTRRIRKSFDSLNHRKNKDINTYKSLFDNFNTKCSEYNNLYDIEVYKVENDGTVLFNKEKQKEWISRVSGELEELKDYEYISD